MRALSGDPACGGFVRSETGRRAPGIVVAGGDLIWAVFGALHLSQALGEPGQFPQYPFEIAHEAIMRPGAIGAKGRSAQPGAQYSTQNGG